MALEYERRFLLSQLPEGISGPAVMLRQVYWTLGSGWVLRLRRTGDPHNLDDEFAIKGPRHGMGRMELEFPMRDSKSQPRLAELARAASELYLAGSGAQVVKTRHSHLDEDGNAWDIDEFHLANDGLFIAEIEARSASEIADISIPPWADREVTEDPKYDNERLAFRPISEW